MDREKEIYVGRFYGERPRQITPDVVQTYSEGVDDFNPWYFGDSPFGGPVAPALALHSEVYKDLSWYLSIFGNLHARQEWELFHPTMVGEDVTARSQVVERYSKRDRDYVVNEVTVYGADGRLLNRGRTHQSFLQKRRGEDQVVVDKDREKRADRTFEVEDGEILEELSAPAKFVSIEMCQKFSGPQKNYHNDVESARALGFPDIVVQGMMSLCFISEMMTDHFGAGWFQGGRMNVNLVNVVWQGETITAKGLVRAVSVEGSAKRAGVDVWCEKEDGTKVVVGTASGLDF
jgi:acyl dehydratase